ncbi:hypothetical protein [Methanocella sp. MCL-LM]|uniref:hypothetical protein n=1 Tax=Methanocella sp. MCL-LM TaxID=3412035 RepID=UPI003C71ACC8
MLSDKTSLDLHKFRDRINRAAADEFRTASYFQGKGVPGDQMALSVSEGLLDLLEEGQSRDPNTVRLYSEWLYNLIRKEGKKIDTTLDFLDRYEAIVTRFLNNVEDADVDVFFEMCRDFVRRKHGQLTQ